MTNPVSPVNQAIWNKLGLTACNGTVLLSLELFRDALNLARAEGIREARANPETAAPEPKLKFPPSPYERPSYMNNAKRTGWYGYFEGLQPGNHPYPSNRKDLHALFAEAWTEAQTKFPHWHNTVNP